MSDYIPTTEEVRAAWIDAALIRAGGEQGGKTLREFHGDGVWRDTEGVVWVRQSELVDAVKRSVEQGEPSRQIKQLLRDLIDPDDCWFDHHGGCQAHGYLSLKPGERCPHAEAKELLVSAEPVEENGEER